MGLLQGGRLIQVPNTAFVCAKNRDFKNWSLNRGWPLNTGPLYTGSTVHNRTASLDTCVANASDGQSLGWWFGSGLCFFFFCFCFFLRCLIVFR